MRKVDFANLGGLIEADGRIGIHKNGPNTRIAVVRFYNTDSALLNWVLETFGGSVKVANSNSSLGHKICLRIVWSGQKALPILEGIKPYLHGRKANIAAYAIEHISNTDQVECAALSEAVLILNEKGGN